MAKIQMTVDGNSAAAYAAYAFTEVAAIYPITPSSGMAEITDDWAAKGRKNIFNQEVNVVEMQSEAGAAGAFHGSLQAGALTTTFTASQGLLLMIPNMYKAAGELLPGVLHVSARALATHALSIFGDHQDVMAVRQTGCAMLASGSVQEVMDLAPIAHLSALKGRLPFVHFFDGFRTSHEIQKVEALEYEDYAKLVDHKALEEFRSRALSPNHPVIRGTAQNPDIYFQGREASNPFYCNLIPVVEEYLEKVGSLTGRKYGLFDYYGAPDAEYVIVAMGSVTETIEETIDYCNNKGEKYGLIKIHLYRPFSMKHFINALPKSVKKLAVLDRTKEPGAIGEPLYLDVCGCFSEVDNAPVIVGGRFGLGSKDTRPADIAAVYENLKQKSPKNRFTLGIQDDVTGTSLEPAMSFTTEPESRKSCKIWGLGSDGTVGANKQAIMIIGNQTANKVQAYFDYDSKKSGGITISHLRFGETPIKSTYLVGNADYVACHNQSYVNKYDVIDDLKPGGIFVLNCQWSDDELDEHLPAHYKRLLAEKDVQFYTVNAVKIAEEIGLGNRINMVMQGAFFKLINILPEDTFIKALKEAATYSYNKKGEKVVKMNHDAIEKGVRLIHKVNIPAGWRNAEEKIQAKKVEEPEFVKNIMRPMQEQKGHKLPVSAFSGREDGTFPSGSTAYEKRGIAVNVPEWIDENCIQCNQCSYVCPHAVIRPFLLNEEEVSKAPSTFNTLKANGKSLENLRFKIQISPMDCTGCGNCADVCPAKEKALVMKPFDTQAEVQVENWKFASCEVGYKNNISFGKSFKESQFKEPLIEFSGACAGCGETPYIKLITQLFGDRMMIANATGCSSIWGASAPSTAYSTNREGQGPAWANSLFEDNAEFGFGMYLAVKQLRRKLETVMTELIEKPIEPLLKERMEDWLHYKEDGEVTREVSAKLLDTLEQYQSGDAETMQLIEEIKQRKDYLVKRSQWIVGGDGWAYDIGYGGVDQVLSTGEDINILVFDTEVYSNTGGQASKSTPAAAVAKFATSGKKSGKKDLGRMMMTYGNVYVAQVGIHADNNQLIKAIREAENYKGPSIVIAYAPCISHGIREGMGRSMETIKKAVKAGYWHLYRYNPELKKEGKNPFILDSKEPTESFRDFLMGQVRYSSLARTFPDTAEELFVLAEEHAKDRYATYKTLASL
ncbi:pyruvate-flavodoxin oxidoreductase [Anaerocolumna cellulosilytica]|uniref:Pyruvate:ferredoxin oxidoreductase n=1 Tax=Anaerocolumna cellulosilytica TaxID=433286 RepID=A0A6S6R7W8_9FIRM|nr:pyruvate:ferredoxin (flavodoxin) oxidoreductase [Anaerocolumna cellulosilytica]MBB5197891.1 pyruvate-ferredoxin/flavodoxin oxidoreductase [Anaerocolumna cellulosilytica]BCJ95560.1 pyruvate-flavodoxin oxidoreductase [Anaerocolumna cellulosilytica]